MIKKLKNYLIDMRNLVRMNQALIKGNIMMSNRVINPKDPVSWEFSGFSQNGEDGIIHFLRAQLKKRNKYFLEVGASDGVENNSTWLLCAEKYNGVLVEGDKSLADRIDRTLIHHHIGAKCLNVFVTKETLKEVFNELLFKDPDVCSLDIDGNDYFIADGLFQLGLRPKIFVVEYNSAFGPEKSISIEYQKDFNFAAAHPSKLYYGVSVGGWKNFFEKNNYSFVTVDSCGVNAFFVDNTCFDASFLKDLKGLQFQENAYQLKKFKSTFENQFLLIQNERFHKI